MISFLFIPSQWFVISASGYLCVNCARWTSLSLLESMKTWNQFRSQKMMLLRLPPTPQIKKSRSGGRVCVCRFQAHSAAVRLDPIKNSSLWIPCQSLEVKSRPDVPAPQHAEHTRCQKKRKKEKNSDCLLSFFHPPPSGVSAVWWGANIVILCTSSAKQKHVVLRCLCPSESAALESKVWGKLRSRGHMHIK